MVRQLIPNKMMNCAATVYRLGHQHNAAAGGAPMPMPRHLLIKT